MSYNISLNLFSWYNCFGDVMKVSVGVSNRHVHLKEEDLYVLFGDNYKLEKIKDIKQPGQFASSATVTILTEKDSIENVRVMGPVRNYTQVEISKTDAYKLGINPPIRESGDILGSAPISIIGPCGRVDLFEGCIIATRHIHITPKQVELYGLQDVETVDILLPGVKGGILHNVSFRVSDDSYFELHLDTDDANAHLVSSGDIVDILCIK